MSDIVPKVPPTEIGYRSMPNSYYDTGKRQYIVQEVNTSTYFGPAFNFDIMSPEKGTGRIAQNHCLTTYQRGISWITNNKSKLLTCADIPDSIIPSNKLWGVYGSAPVCNANCDNCPDTWICQGGYKTGIPQMFGQECSSVPLFTGTKAICYKELSNNYDKIMWFHGNSWRSRAAPEFCNNNISNSDGKWDTLTMNGTRYSVNGFSLRKQVPTEYKDGDTESCNINCNVDDVIVCLHKA